MAAYFDVFHAAAASAVESGNEEVDDRYAEASEPNTVASHVRHRPFCEGTRVRAIGTFPVVPKQRSLLFCLRNIGPFERSPNEIINLVLASPNAALT